MLFHMPVAVSRCARGAALASVAMLPISATVAQVPAVRDDHPAIKSALAAVKSDKEWTLQQQ